MDKLIKCSLITMRDLMKPGLVKYGYVDRYSTLPVKEVSFTDDFIHTSWYKNVLEGADTEDIRHRYKTYLLNDEKLLLKQRKNMFVKRLFDKDYADCFRSITTIVNYFNAFHKNYSFVHSDDLEYDKYKKVLEYFDKGLDLLFSLYDDLTDRTDKNLMLIFRRLADYYMKEYKPKNNGRFICFNSVDSLLYYSICKHNTVSMYFLGDKIETRIRRSYSRNSTIGRVMKTLPKDVTDVLQGFIDNNVLCPSEVTVCGVELEKVSLLPIYTLVDNNIFFDLVRVLLSCFMSFNDDICKSYNYEPSKYKSDFIWPLVDKARQLSKLLHEYEFYFNPNAISTVDTYKDYITKFYERMPK